MVKSERKEAWLRIIVAIVSGIILKVWGILFGILVIIQWLIVVFSGKVNDGISDFCNLWTEQAYKFVKYIAFYTNERPFPFAPMKKKR